jgi:hypothetical protein
VAGKDSLQVVMQQSSGIRLCTLLLGKWVQHSCRCMANAAVATTLRTPAKGGKKLAAQGGSKKKRGQEGPKLEPRQAAAVAMLMHHRYPPAEQAAEQAGLESANALAVQKEALQALESSADMEDARRRLAAYRKAKVCSLMVFVTA